jgi:Zn-dependent oligopeptidase
MTWNKTRLTCADNAACQDGSRTEAFISWYFSIAHELAHNLGKSTYQKWTLAEFTAESAHNSAHEFYFSSIAEEYLTPFIALLGSG